MGHVDLNAVSFFLPDGRVLLRDVTFRVGDGAKVALVGANGAGKTTLLRIVSGDIDASDGAVTRSGGLGVMRQFVGSVRDESTIRDLLVSVAPPAIRTAAVAMDRAEHAMMEQDDEPTQLRYAQALADWADAGGYDAEVLWDTCTVAALGVPYERAQWRDVRTLSGGEQKRLVLEALLRGPDQVLLLDEPDNYLDVLTKRWLEEELRESPKTVLFVSHDRELLSRTATRVVTVELGAAGNTVWTHGGGFATYHQARRDRFSRLEELLRRWDEEHQKLRELMLMYKQKAAYNSKMAGRYQAAVTRLRMFEEAGPPEAVPDRAGRHDAAAWGAHRQAGRRLRGPRADRADEAVRPRGLVRRPGRGPRLQRLRQVALPAAARGRGQRPRRRAPAGRRRAHRAGEPHRDRPPRRTGAARLVRADPRAPRAGRPDPARHPVAGRRAPAGMGREEASRALDRYELAHAAEQRFETLSGGQQARLQILLLELSGATLLLLDEPTDNLDLVSAEALEEGLEAFAGTVAGRHPRPVVRPRLRPVPRLRRGRAGLRVRRADLGRGPGAARPVSICNECRGFHRSGRRVTVRTDPSHRRRLEPSHAPVPRPALLAAIALVVGLVIPLAATRATADHTPLPSRVTLMGDLMSELGCPGDWDESCDKTDLPRVGDSTVFARVFQVPAGSYQFKVRLNGSWNENYGDSAGTYGLGGNIPLPLGHAARLRFSYDHATHRVVVAPADDPAPVGPGDAALAATSLRKDLTRERFYFVMADRFANGTTANDKGGLTGDRLSTGFDPTSKALLPRRRPQGDHRPARLHRGPRHHCDLDDAVVQEQAGAGFAGHGESPATTATGSPTSPRSTRTWAPTPSSRR